MILEDNILGEGRFSKLTALYALDRDSILCCISTPNVRRPAGLSTWRWSILGLWVGVIRVPYCKTLTPVAAQLFSLAMLKHTPSGDLSKDEDSPDKYERTNVLRFVVHVRKCYLSVRHGDTSGGRLPFCRDQVSKSCRPTFRGEGLANPFLPAASRTASFSRLQVFHDKTNWGQLRFRCTRKTMGTLGNYDPRFDFWLVEQ